MVNEEMFKRYKDMEAPDLRMRVIALDTENNILKAQIQSLRDERNKLMRKVADVDLSRNDEPRLVQQNNGMSNPPKLNPRPVQ
jgi:seryl-tRNA synthetase